VDAILKVVDDSRAPSVAPVRWQGDGAVVIEVAPLNGDSKEDTLHTTLDRAASRSATLNWCS